MSPKILITGSIAYDVLLGYEGSFADAIDPKSLEHLSLSFFSPRYTRHHGGTAANIAWNLRLLGGDPLMVGTVGSDGGPYKSLLAERGVDVTYIEERKEHVTATAIIGTDQASARSRSSIPERMRMAHGRIFRTSATTLHTALSVHETPGR